MFICLFGVREVISVISRTPRKPRAAPTQQAATVVSSHAGRDFDNENDINDDYEVVNVASNNNSNKASVKKWFLNDNKGERADDTVEAEVRKFSFTAEQEESDVMMTNQFDAIDVTDLDENYLPPPLVNEQLVNEQLVKVNEEALQLSPLLHTLTEDMVDDDVVEKFTRAASAGDIDQMESILAEDATVVDQKNKQV